MSGLVHVQRNAIENLLSRRTSDFQQEALSDATKAISRNVGSLINNASPSAIPGSANTPEEVVFQSLATAKVLTSQVAMHLETGWRKKLFAQLDSLHDVGEWEQGDRPVNSPSFKTFLQAMIFLAVKNRPGLGLSQTGNIIAAWNSGSNELTLEFRPDGAVQWIVSRFVGDEQERAVGLSPVVRIAAVLTPYDPEAWFSREIKKRQANEKPTDPS